MIIAASGMCEGGRILHHLKNNISDPQTTILFVGFQAENTLGRRLMDGFKDVKIFGEPYPVHAQIESIAGFSAHADRKGLHGWIERFDKRRLRGVFLVHGELDAATDLAFNIESNGLPRPAIPVRGQGFDL
jgi:metallo-beta-lactamase family protein